MLWFSKINHGARVKHSTRARVLIEIASDPNLKSELHGTCNRRVWISNCQGSISLMKVKPWVNTDSIQCTSKELFIQSVLLWYDMEPIFALLPNGFFQQQRKSSPYTNWSTAKSLWAGFLVQALLAFAHIGYELMRSCWLCNYSCIAGCVVVLVSFSLRRALPSLWSSSLWTLCSAVWYWRLLASRSRSALSRVCASCLVSAFS